MKGVDRIKIFPGLPPDEYYVFRLKLQPRDRLVKQEKLYYLSMICFYLILKLFNLKWGGERDGVDVASELLGSSNLVLKHFLRGVLSAEQLC